MKSSMVTAKGQVEDANYAEETAKLAEPDFDAGCTAMLAQAMLRNRLPEIGDGLALY